MGHPSTLHLWWARRPLAAARAVIFSSLITDPGDPEYPWRAGQERDIEAERARLHSLIVEMVQWTNSTNEAVLARVHAEIDRHTDGNPPPLLDPFAGGGAIPLEAQRLGLQAHASDLNPVAVLINKAMIEIPPTFAGQAPVNPERQGSMSTSATWKGATGLADDVRCYGKWMRDEAERRIGHLYPKVTLPAEQGGGEATVIAWLWARTVTCPNPACGATMPLVSSYWLSKKQGRETWLVPHVEGKTVTFKVASGPGQPVNPPKQGRGARFACLVCGEIAPVEHVKAEGAAKRMGQQLLAIVAEGGRGRAYLASNPEHVQAAIEVNAGWRPNQALPDDAQNCWTLPYGITTFGDLFTDRQLNSLSAFVELVMDTRNRVIEDAITAKRSIGGQRLRDGGEDADAYADAISTYLALAVDRLADYGSSICSWHSGKELIRNSFGRPVIPMVWDFTEVNPLSHSTGNFLGACEWIAEVLEQLPASSSARASQEDAVQLRDKSGPSLVSMDPPYYDNIGYADLSDFFYVWLGMSISSVWPDLFRSLQVPKLEELVASSARFNKDKQQAKEFFETGLRRVFSNVAKIQDEQFPATIYYAFKQAESAVDTNGIGSVASTGWETMLAGLVSSGFQITATWPMRTEMANRSIASGTNALASSIVLACRVRQESAPETTRQQFVRELHQKLRNDLRPLQQANIAPVDLAQAAIGPGMAIYSRYRRVRDASGEDLTVRGALGLINAALDEVLAELDEEYDNATRWAISWYENHGVNEGPYGDAEGLARARNVGVADLAHDGLVISGRGKVRLLPREEYGPLPEVWHPRGGDVSDWVIMQRLAQAVQTGQELAAAVKARIDAVLPGRTDTARDLAYRVFNIAERKGLNREALVYNTLVQNWAGVDSQADKLAPSDIIHQLRLDA